MFTHYGSPRTCGKAQVSSALDVLQRQLEEERLTGFGLFELLADRGGVGGAVLDSVVEARRFRGRPCHRQLGDVLLKRAGVELAAVMLSSQRLWPRLCRNSYFSFKDYYSLAPMPIVIPQSDYRVGKVMLIAERTQACRAQQEVPPSSPGFESKPAGSQHSNEMPARKNQYVSLDPADPVHHAVGPRDDLFGRLSPRATVTKQFPVRTLLHDFGGAAALVFSVVPFDQIGIRFGHGSEASEFTGASSALQRTGENLGNDQSAQPFPKPLGVVFAAFGQRQIGQARVLTRKCSRRSRRAGPGKSLEVVRSRFRSCRNRGPRPNRPGLGG